MFLYQKNYIIYIQNYNLKMSQFLLKTQNQDSNKDENYLKFKSQKKNKNSKISNYANRNNSLLNVYPTENNLPYKINNTNTQTNFSSNNIHSKLKSEKLKIKTESNVKKLNKIQIESSILDNKDIRISENNINKYRIFSANILKNKKRISFLNPDNINKRETQIYLNSFVDKSIIEDKNQRIRTSKGFAKKSEVETEKILYKKNKRQLTSYKNEKQNHIKNLDLNLHKNNIRYDYISTEKNQNILSKDIYYNLIMKYKNEKKKNIQNNHINQTEKDKYFISIINNITRKVQFLNTKNDFLSNENTMNLLNKEELFLYRKLKEYLKDNFSIKKFSKSILDKKSGNKYLLPFFNEINLFKTNYEENNLNEINKNDDNFNKYEDRMNEKNNIKQKNVFEVYLNQQLKMKKPNNYINNLYLQTNDEKLQFESDKSFDKNNNLQNYYNIYNNNNINKIIILKNHDKNELIEKQQYQEYKMKIIKENEYLINNYHKKSNNSTRAFLKRKERFKYNFNNNIIPIRNNNIRKNKESEKTKEYKIFKIQNKENKNENKKENNSNKKIRLSYSEKKQILANNNEKTNKINDKFKDRKKIKEKSQGLFRNSSKKNKKENIEQNENIKINKIARLSTKNYDEKNQILKINKTSSDNEDIKNVLNKENNFFPEYSGKFFNDTNIYKSSLNDSNIIENNENELNNKEKNENKKLGIEKISNKLKSNSKTVETDKKEENNLNNITMSNNFILKETIKNEENKLIAKIEKKKNTTLKLLYSFLKSHIKNLIFEKDKIKELLNKPEFKKNFDLLKSQMNQLNELSNQNSNKIKRNHKSLTDEDIIDIIYNEFNSQNHKKVELDKPKSSYKASLHLKKRTSRKKQQTEIKRERKKEESHVNENIKKENEKLELMATEISFQNELKHHIRETNNKEFKARFQIILERIESYQKLSTSEYIETFKKNYSSLKEEMNQILRDKEKEERINNFMTHLDSERNIFEKKWNFCNDKIYVMDNKFQTSFGRYQNNNNTKNKN